MVTVLYLKNVQQFFPIGQDIVGSKELKGGALLFRTPRISACASHSSGFGEDREGFLSKACERLGGHRMDMAGRRLSTAPLSPRLALYFLLWTGDDEFKPRIQVLFDRPIETILAAGRHLGPGESGLIGIRIKEPYPP